MNAEEEDEIPMIAKKVSKVLFNGPTNLKINFGDSAIQICNGDNYECGEMEHERE